jgi:hypothetical protein
LVYIGVIFIPPLPGGGGGYTVLPPVKEKENDTKWVMKKLTIYVGVGSRRL